jgi:cysteinyl-tRNA synthetase
LEINKVLKEWYVKAADLHDEIETIEKDTKAIEEFVIQMNDDFNTQNVYTLILQLVKDLNVSLRNKDYHLLAMKVNSLKEKLNKTIDMLNNMQDYLIENRIIARRTSKLIDGVEITDEELAVERIKLEAIKYGK